MGLFHNATLSAILNKYFSISTLPVRYDEVVEACALPSDFKQLPAGDQTEVGERGIIDMLIAGTIILQESKYS